MGRSTEVDDGFLARVRASRSLPSPPVVAAKLIELGEDPDVGLAQLVDVLRTDPALSARLLRIANSPLYARRRRADNLQQAVVMLGMDAVFTAALSLTIMSDREALGSSSLSLHDRWTRTVHAAVAAQLLAQRCRGVVPADAFLAALVQDIGILVMGRLEPEIYDDLRRDADHDAFCAAEVARVGVDHAVVGAELLSAWQLPVQVCEAVRLSHEGSPGDSVDDRLASVVAISALVADWIGGDLDKIQVAGVGAERLLGVDAEAFSALVDDIIAALPDLAPMLNADVPSAEVLTEMAADAMVARQLMHSTAVEQLREDLAGLTEVTRQLEEANRVDPLTGLLNRRHLDQALADEFATARRYGHDLTVLFVDLDDFKQVNDTHGHHVGDEVLRRVADSIVSTVRDGDHVGRYGGDEFVIVLPATLQWQAEAVADRVLRDIGAVRLTGDDGPPQLPGITIGVAAMSQLDQQATVHDLVQAADSALLNAKRSGKGCWSSTPLGVSGASQPA